MNAIGTMSRFILSNEIVEKLTKPEHESPVRSWADFYEVAISFQASKNRWNIQTQFSENCNHFKLVKDDGIEIEWTFLQLCSFRNITLIFDQRPKNPSWRKMSFSDSINNPAEFIVLFFWKIGWEAHITTLSKQQL